MSQETVSSFDAKWIKAALCEVISQKKDQHLVEILKQFHPSHQNQVKEVLAQMLHEYVIGSFNGGFVRFMDLEAEKDRSAIGLGRKPTIAFYRKIIQDLTNIGFYKDNPKTD